MGSTGKSASVWASMVLTEDDSVEVYQDRIKGYSWLSLGDGPGFTIHASPSQLLRLAAAITDALCPEVALTPQWTVEEILNHAG